MLARCTHTLIISHTHTQSHVLSYTYPITYYPLSYTYPNRILYLSYAYPITYPLSYTYPTTCPPINIPNHLFSHTHTQSHVLSHTHTLITSSTLTQSHILSYTYLSYISISPHTSITSQSIPIMHNLIASSPISYYYVYIFSSVKDIASDHMWSEEKSA